MKKKKVIPAVVLFLSLSIFFLTFGSSCGCLDPDEQFARYIYLIKPSEITPEAVQKGFERHFPKGSSFDSKTLLEVGEDGENIFLPKGASLICTYYYEHNAVAKRGYRVIIEFDADGKVAAVKTAEISRWFGVEFSKLSEG